MSSNVGTKYRTLCIVSCRTGWSYGELSAGHVGVARRACCGGGGAANRAPVPCIGAIIVQRPMFRVETPTSRHLLHERHSKVFDICSQNFHPLEACLRSNNLKIERVTCAPDLPRTLNETRCEVPPACLCPCHLHSLTLPDASTWK
jgi:hypothetical protein